MSARDAWANRVDGTLEADDVQMGVGVVIEQGVVIKAKRIVIGDFAFIGRETKVTCSEFRLGDYSKWHERGFAYGEGCLQIGRNCWIGGGVILDPKGGLVLDDGVGVGGGSQVWTHIQFGDVVQGCRFKSTRAMHVGADAWFVGHCLVSPVRVEERSMALLGSVVTRDMEANRVYGGNPAKDITDKVGPQFEARTETEKVDALNRLIARFEADQPRHTGYLYAFVGNLPKANYMTTFDVTARTYTQTYSAAEVAFLKAHTPLVKFTPAGAGPFVDVSLLEREAMTA